MKKDDTIFLRHILDAISLIEEYLKGKSYEEFKNNRMLQDAVIRESQLPRPDGRGLSLEGTFGWLTAPQ